jgi:hypothetical protein
MTGSGCSLLRQAINGNQENKKAEMKRPIAIIGATLLLALIVWIWKMATQDLYQTETRPKGNGNDIINKFQSKPRQDSVEFPSFGEVKGRFSNQTLECEDSSGYMIAFKPEKLLLDEQGRFLYLRNREPVHDTKKRIDLIEPLMRKSLSQIFEDRPVNDLVGLPNSFKILGAAPFDLQGSEVKRMLYELAAHRETDIEVWSLNVFHPILGETGVMLKSSMQELYIDKNGHAAVWEYGSARYISIYPVNWREDYTADRIKIIEEWNVAPANAQRDERFGFPWEGEELYWEEYIEARQRAGEKDFVMPPPPPPKKHG